MVAPHLRREGVILAVAEGDWLRAANVRPQAKPQVLASDIHPDVPARIARAPLKQHAGLVFLEPTAPLQALAVQGLEQLGDAAFTHDTPRGLAARVGVRLIARGRRVVDVVTHGRAELLLVAWRRGQAHRAWESRAALLKCIVPRQDSAVECHAGERGGGAGGRGVRGWVCAMATG